MLGNFFSVFRQENWAKVKTSCFYNNEFLFRFGYSSFLVLTGELGHYNDEFNIFMMNFVQPVP